MSPSSLSKEQNNEGRPEAMGTSTGGNLGAFIKAKTSFQNKIEK